MGNVLSFEKKSEENPDGIKIIPNPGLEEILEEKTGFDEEYDEYDSEIDFDDIEDDTAALLDDVYEVINEIDDFIREALKETDIRNAEFMMDDESVSRLLDEFERDFFVEYHGKSQDSESNVDYRAILSMYDYDENESDYRVLVLKFTDSSAWRYRADTKSWEEDRYLRKIYDAMNRGEGTAEFIRKFEEITSHDILAGDSASTADLIMRIQPLCKLYELLSDVADFQIMFSLAEQPDGEEDKPSLQISVSLLPDDSLREGCMVEYRQGKFQVLRCFDPYMLSEMHESWDGDPDMMEEPYFVEAFSEPSIKKAAQILREMWDHYSKDTVFCFPLSDSAYTEYRTYSGKLVTVTRNGTRKLTRDEAAALREVKEVLQLG